MKKKLLLIFMTVAVIFTSVSVLPTDAKMIGQAIANYNAVAFVKANTSSKRLGMVYKGTVINVLAIEGEWLKGELNGTVGYVKKKYFKEYAKPKSKGEQIIDFGDQFLGTPYKLGGGRRDNQEYFDCSGFVWYVLTQNGVNMTMKGARAQSEYGYEVSFDNLKVGDLVYFSTGATRKYDKDSIKRIGHVGIYAGNGKMLHTFGKNGVEYSDITKGYWKDNFVKAKRVL